MSAPTRETGWTDPVRAEVIIGSVREGRFGPVVANWFVGQATPRTDLDVGVLDLAEQPADFTGRIGAADAVVVVTPEYNHSYPGPLKAAIDGVGPQHWQAKPLGFVSYGGLSGGLRAVEPLRVVFAELHAMSIRDTVSFHMYPQLFDGSGELKDPEGPTAAAKVLLDRLVWWARTLRAGRAVQPYGG
ncbi:NAD(P)H-dependent oxidoreductase [Pseudonocardia eucalypti]|uniref:NAD(P)H-dependent oxidoreductase n=1 Tax=Pseudonocardia eucalypti TaxID=648755 RepID=A0ABP9PZI3_9PSEU|nr:NAD(P)H-dependent FMN reductase [Pseudonocardia eucalypti]